MALPHCNSRADRPSGWASCLASLAIHACLIVALAGITRGYLTRGPQPGAADQLVLRLAEEGPEVAGEAIVELNGDPLGDRATLADADFSTLLQEAETAPEVAAPTRLLMTDLLGSRATTTSAAGSGAGSDSEGGGQRPRLGGLVDSTRLSVFGAEAVGTKFVFVFDHSTSMAGAPLAAAKEQLIESFDALESVHQFQVIFFNHQMRAPDLTGGQHRVPFATDANKALAARFIDRVIAAGGTERRTPLMRALAMTPDAVFFLTDADDAMPSYDVDEAVRRAQRSSTAVACIEFGEGPASRGENFLSRLARDTGGQYVYVDTAGLRWPARR
jgi:hypothetical protein